MPLTHTYFKAYQVPALLGSSATCNMPSSSRAAISCRAAALPGARARVRACTESSRRARCGARSVSHITSLHAFCAHCTALQMNGQHVCTACMQGGPGPGPGVYESPPYEGKGEGEDPTSGRVASLIECTCSQGSPVCPVQDMQPEMPACRHAAYESALPGAGCPTRCATGCTKGTLPRCMHACMQGCIHHAHSRIRGQTHVTGYYS